MCSVKSWKASFVSVPAFNRPSNVIFPRLKFRTWLPSKRTLAPCRRELSHRGADAVDFRNLSQWIAVRVVNHGRRLLDGKVVRLAFDPEETVFQLSGHFHAVFAVPAGTGQAAGVLDRRKLAVPLRVDL